MTPNVLARLPYPGLRSFRREETDLFFGRERCVHAMVDRLKATRLLAVLGSSGTGKSSLVMTGLLDALDLGLMVDAGSDWRVIDFRPGGAPLRNLARRLFETAQGEDGAEDPETQIDLFCAFLARSPRSVIEWYEAGHLPKGSNLLLLVDQFEELFRYEDYAEREEAEAFVALLLESARAPNLPIYVALTMRSEYLGACSLIEGLAEAINAGMYLTPRMTREQCRAAIVGPAGVGGFKIEDTLVNRLLNDLASFAPFDNSGGTDQLDRIARRADQLPLLQYTLNRMWVRAKEASGGERIALGLTEYDAIGGLAGALDAHADEIVGSLGPGHLPVIETVFRALTAGTTIMDAVRRPRRFGEVVKLCNDDETAVRTVVEAFRAPNCNFLVPGSSRPLQSDTDVDITHESLIRHWNKLSEWLAKEAQAAQHWRHLKEAAANYRKHKGDLLRGLDLANLVAWWQHENPKPAWAERYGDDYDGAKTFLRTSQDVEKQSRRWVFARRAVVAVVLTLCVGVGALWYKAYPATVNEVKELVEYIDTEHDSGRIDTIPTLWLLDRVKSEFRLLAWLPAFLEPEPGAHARLHLSLALSKTYFDLDTGLITSLEFANEANSSALSRAEKYPGDTHIQEDLSTSYLRVGEALEAKGDFNAALAEFKDMGSHAEKMKRTSQPQPDERNVAIWLFYEAVAHGKACNILRQQGNLNEARDECDNALEIGKKLRNDRCTKDDTSNCNAWFSLSRNHERKGDVLLAGGNLRGALGEYEEKLRLAKGLAQANPDNIDWKEDLLIAYENKGDILRAIGCIDDIMRNQRCTDDANAQYDQQHTIAATLAENDKNNARWQFDLAIAAERTGDVVRARREFDKAGQYYEDFLKRLKALYDKDPARTRWWRNLALAHERRGDLRLDQDDRPGARDEYVADEKIVESLTMQYPQRRDWRRDLAVARRKVGDVRLADGDLEGALEQFKKSQAIILELTGAAPFQDQDDWRRDLAISYQKIGDVYWKMGRPDDARDPFEKCRSIQVTNPYDPRNFNPNNTEKNDVIKYCKEKVETISRK
jgi:tetratricopeptide (TPR) repeat protein